MRKPKLHEIVILTVSVMFLCALALSIERDMRLNDTRKELAATNEQLGTATKLNLDRNAELEAKKADFQSCAQVATIMNEVSKELRDILVEYEDSSVDTIDWMVDNAYFYDEDRQTARALVDRHYNRIDDLFDRFGEISGYLSE